MGSSLLQFTLEHTTFVARKSTDTCPFESERGADVRFRVHNRADPRVRVCRSRRVSFASAFAWCNAVFESIDLNSSYLPACRTQLDC